METMLNHTSLRIRDPETSLEFYKKHFGMSLLKTLTVTQHKFTNYFMAFDSEGSCYHGIPWYLRQGILELSYTHGAEVEGFKANNGNEEPYRGFGHICFSVPNLEEKCAELEANGVKFKKRMSEGRQKDIAFVLDPDGYWIELIQNSGVSSRFNHTMLRVKDKNLALNFFENKLGMKLVDKMDNPDANFTLFFLSFKPLNGPRMDEEGLLELTYNYGTEKDKDFAYHSGNVDPKGYGHLCIVVDDIYATVKQLEEQGVKITKQPQDGDLKFLAFIEDPDGYSIEILPKKEMPSDF